MGEVVQPAVPTHLGFQVPWSSGALPHPPAMQPSSRGERSEKRGVSRQPARERAKEEAADMKQRWMFPAVAVLLAVA